MSALNAKTICDRIDSNPSPVLTWFSEDGSERIELGGPVARLWLAKTDNFMASEFPFGGSRFAVLLPPHWRSPFWIMASWLRGMELVSPATGAQADLLVANDVDVLVSVLDEGGPDALVAQTADSMALSWPGDLPPQILDGTADIMSYGDYVEHPETADPNAHVVSKEIDWLPPNVWAKPDEVTLPLRSLRGLEYVGEIVDIEGNPMEDAAALEGARALVMTNNTVLFTAQLIQLWMAGASVVWAPGGGISPEQVDAEQVNFKVGIA